METLSIHFSHPQLACNPRMHIKTHFLFKLIGFAGVWHSIVILRFGGFTILTAVLHSQMVAEVHEDNRSEGRAQNCFSRSR